MVRKRSGGSSTSSEDSFPDPNIMRQGSIQQLFRGCRRAGCRAAHIPGLYWDFAMLSRRHFFLGCFAGAALRFPALGAKKPAERVNVLFLTADYLPSWVLGAYGNGEIHTPNLDRLAQMGTRFSRHLVCAPEPEQNLQVLLTGRTPRQLNGGAPSGVPTLAGLLRAAGYSCHKAHAAEAVQLLDGQGLGKPLFLH